VSLASDIGAKLEGWPLYDNAVVGHGFTPYLRDYDVLVETSAAAPGSKRSYIEGRYRLRFTHCVIARIETAVPDEMWHVSWEDHFTNYEAWEAAGQPEGYVWGVNYSSAYPGASYSDDSPQAREWTERMGKPMHDISIETNGHNLRLIFHELHITKIAQGTPEHEELTPLMIEEPID
jgi:hypothetical protein